MGHDRILAGYVYRVKRKKIANALKRLREAGPEYPVLQSHKYQSLRGLQAPLFVWMFLGSRRAA